MREEAPPPGYTVDLFSDEQSPLSTIAGLSWPDGRRFPLNLDAGKVKDVVLPDLKHAQSALLVSGYASLDRLIDFVATCPDESRPHVMIGHEPHPSRRETYELTGRSLPLEVGHYWLERGVSLHLSAKLLHFIERLKEGTIQARYLPGGTPLHAKIYVGDDGATIGSSNFTESGLRLQMEANARFSATQERVRYAELKQVAENFWTMGRDYRDELIALLEQLLRVVSWQEALARACARIAFRKESTCSRRRHWSIWICPLWSALQNSEWGASTEWTVRTRSLKPGGPKMRRSLRFRRTKGLSSGTRRLRVCLVPICRCLMRCSDIALQ
jgi:hypothetical protein